MSLPKVSVIMSTHARNHGVNGCDNLLKRSIDSILGQEFKDFELILLDDASKDGTEEVCRGYEQADKRVRYFRYDQGCKGLTARRYNDGMRFARADLFMFMFDDDELLPSAIGDLHGAITGENSGCGMVYGLADMVHDETGRNEFRLGGEWSETGIRENNFICNFSVIVKREAINVVGGYDEDPMMKRNCDWDLWIRIGSKFSVARIEKLVGICHFSQPDGIGLTVPMTDADMAKIRLRHVQDRKIRLQGELGKPFSLRFGQYNTDAALIRWAIGYLSEALKGDGFDSEVVNLASLSGRTSCETSDVSVFYRTYDTESLDYFKRLKAQGRFLGYFLDDYIFQKDCKYAPDAASKIIPFFELSNVLISSNSYLLGKMKGDNKILRRSALNAEVLDLLGEGGFMSKARGVYTIGWLAGLGRNEMNGFVAEVLKKVQEILKPDERVRFVCFGSHGLESTEQVEVSQFLYFKPADWRELYQKYREFEMDVVINPLDESDEFVSCKAELKYIECGAANVPIVTARVHPFTEVIKEGENGFFASTPEEYAKKALMVCRNGLLAKSVAETANENVRSRYNSITNARQFIANVMDAMQVKAEVKRREYPVEPLPLLKKKLEKVDKTVVGPLAYGQVFEFAISLMPDCELQGISVLGATYCKPVQLGMDYQVWINGKRHRGGVVSPAMMKDNEWWTLLFQPLILKRGDTMTLRLMNRDDLINLGFYACEDKTIGRAKLVTKMVSPIALRLIEKSE